MSVKMKLGDVVEDVLTGHSVILRELYEKGTEKEAYNVRHYSASSGEFFFYTLYTFELRHPKDAKVGFK